MGGIALALAYEGDDDERIEPWCEPSDIKDGGGDVDLETVCAVATEILFILSGRRYGVRRKIVRPGAKGCGWGESSHELVLAGPIRAIHSITENGKTLVKDTDFRVLDRRRLLRMGSIWLHQRLDLLDSETDVTAIDFSWGRDVPEGGKASARHFADQLVKYFNNDKKCALPDRMVNITRQGTSHVIMDPSEFTKLSKTGLYLVDTWLGAVNPTGARRRPRVMGPDNIRKSRIT